MPPRLYLSIAPLAVAVSFVMVDRALILATADVACSASATCEWLLRPGSSCINGTCSNPFSGGCLRRMLGEASYPKRTCNSDDPPDAAESGQCVMSPFDYPEIRVSSQSWESPMFLSWIYQILLSERLGVPVTIETGSAQKKLSFYDPEGTSEGGSVTYDYDAMRRAHNVGDCRASTSRGISCAHVLPEAWNGQEDAWKEAEDEGYIEQVEGSGVLGKFSWYVPMFLAEIDPTLFFYHGLRGEDNRRKLAETFKRPTTWLDYCEAVSPNSCASDDGIAERAPQSESEEGSYYANGLYKGHFRYMNKNNCTLNPTTCTGHFTDIDCTWTTYATSQIYWNNISLESDGPMQPNGGYSYDSVIQISQAAIATKSPVMVYRYRPEPNLQLFQGGPAEFQPVLLPTPTQACKVARVGLRERCSVDPGVQWGDPAGSCDAETQALGKFIVRSLYDRTYAAPEASRSPAYETLKGIRVSDLDIEAMYSAWNGRGIDRDHDAREAVCSWVAANIEDLERFIPRGYPRELREGDSLYKVGYLYGAMAVGGAVTLVVIAAGTATYYWRRRKVMVYAQYHFLLLILMGLVLVSAGAVVYALEPSLATCITRQWLVTLGYTMGLVPLLVKIAAINKLLQEASRSKRVKLSPRRLLADVAMCVMFVTAFLIVWTAVDPPKAVKELSLVEEGGTIVEVTLDCVSSSNAWIIIAYCWELLLLVCATVLAFQNRDMKEEFGESRCVGNLVYSHFLFLILRGVTYLLSPLVKPNVRAGITGFLLSIDTLFALIIYFAPKFIAAASARGDNTPSRHGSRRPRQKTWSEVKENNSPREGAIPIESAIYYDIKASNSSLPAVSEEDCESVRSGFCQPPIEGLDRLHL